MHKSQGRNLNKINHGNFFLLPKPHQNSTTESKDNELAEMSEREIRSLLLKMTHVLKEDSNKPKNEVRVSIRDLEKKSCNMEEKC
jgi:hypothetical protein